MLRTLTALLAISPGVPVPIDTVIDELWGEALPRDPRPALQALVSRLRRWAREAGGPEHAVRLESDGYLLDASPERVDLARFVLATRAVLQLPEAEPSEVLAMCDRAQAEWRGAPFGGCASTPILDSERRRLDELAVSVAERRAAALVALGQYEVALADIRALLAQNPAQEGLVAAAMTALYRSGRQQEALQVYQDFRRFLGETFGLDPSPALVELEGSVLRHEPQLAHGPLGWRGCAVSTITRPLIAGRDHELAAIARYRTDGAGQFVVVTGEAGVGKTTLVRAALADASAEGARVGVGSCERGDAPLSAWRQALRQLDVDLAKIATPEGVALAELVRDAVAAVAVTTPMVLALEDFHRADSASLGLLLALARGGPVPGVELLVTAREPDAEPNLAWSSTLADLMRAPGTCRLELGALDRSAIHEVMATRLSHLHPDTIERLSSLVEQRSGGHALHLAALLDVLALQGDENACRAASARVPDQLLPLIRHHLGSLPRGCRDAVEALAVVGPGPASAVASALDTSPIEALRVLRPAIDLGLVAHGDGALRLRHALTEQVVVEGTPPATRHQLHADALDRLGTAFADPFTILRHAEGAGPLVGAERLGAAQLAAARRAYASGAFDEALVLATKATANAGSGDRPHAELYRGLALAAVGRTAEADEVLDGVVHSCDKGSECAVLAAVGHEPLGLRVSGDQRRLARLQAVFATAPTTPSTLRIDLLRALIAEETLVYGELRSVAARDELSRLAEVLDSDEDRARLAQLAARDLVEAPVPAGHRLEVTEEAHALAERSKDVLLRLNAMEMLASAALAAGDLDRCLDVVWELSRLAERAGRPRSRWVARIVYAGLLLAGGDPGADAAAEGAMTFGNRAGIPDAVGAYGVHLVARHLLEGDLRPALQLTEMATVMYPNVPAWQAAASLAHAHNGDTDLARTELERALRLRRQSSVRLFDRPGLTLAAHAAAWLDHKAAAEEILSCLPADRAVVVVGAGAAILGPVNLAVALAELTAGRPQAAAVHLGQAAALAADLHWAPWVKACERWARAADRGAMLDSPVTSPPGL